MLITFVEGKTLSKKRITTLSLLTAYGTLGSRNYNQAFAVTGNESFTLLQRKFGPLLLVELS